MNRARVLVAAWITTVLVVAATPGLRAHILFGARFFVGYARMDSSGYLSPTLPRGDDHEAERQLQKAMVLADTVAVEGLPRQRDPGPLAEFCVAHPKDFVAHSALVRLIAYGLPAARGMPHDGASKTLLAASLRMQTIEPENWYWRLGEVRAELALDHVDAAVAAMKRAPIPTKLDERTLEQTRVLRNALNPRFGRLPISQQAFIDAAITFPHYEYLMRVATLARERPGDIALRAAICDLGASYVRESETSIGMLIGISSVKQSVFLVSRLGRLPIGDAKVSAVAYFKQAYLSERSISDWERILHVINAPKYDPSRLDFGEVGLTLGPVFVCVGLLLSLSGFCFFLPWRLSLKSPVVVGIFVLIATLPMLGAIYRLSQLVNENGPIPHLMDYARIFVILAGTAMIAARYARFRDHIQGGRAAIIFVGVIGALGISIPSFGICAGIAILFVAAHSPGTNYPEYFSAVFLAFVALILTYSGYLPAWLGVVAPMLVTGYALTLITVRGSRIAPFAVALLFLFVGLGFGTKADRAMTKYLEAENQGIERYRAAVFAP